MTGEYCKEAITGLYSAKYTLQKNDWRIDIRSILLHLLNDWIHLLIFQNLRLFLSLVRLSGIQRSRCRFWKMRWIQSLRRCINSDPLTWTGLDLSADELCCWVRESSDLYPGETLSDFSKIVSWTALFSSPSDLVLEDGRKTGVVRGKRLTPIRGARIALQFYSLFIKKI